MQWKGSKQTLLLCIWGCLIQILTHRLPKLIKIKGFPCPWHEGIQGEKLHSFSTPALEGGAWSTSCPSHFTPWWQNSSI